MTETPMQTLKRLHAKTWQDIRGIAEHQLEHEREAARQRTIDAVLEVIAHLPVELAIQMLRAVIERDHMIAFDERLHPWLMRNRIELERYAKAHIHRLAPNSGESR